MASNIAWQKIFNDWNLRQHDFSSSPAIISAEQIKQSCSSFEKVADREVRILCKQDCSEKRPEIFRELGLFILPKKNGEYYIIKGNGYVEIPEIEEPIQDHVSALEFELQSSGVGDSEMQHIDFAYASSLIRTFMNDPYLVLTIRGRKYSPGFTFNVEGFSLDIEGVQTEVDAGYESKDSIVLLEAKNAATRNIIIRQLYFPFRQWSKHINKPVQTLFFERRMIAGEPVYHIWQFGFKDPNNYNSITLIRAKRYRIISSNSG